MIEVSVYGLATGHCDNVPHTLTPSSGSLVPAPGLGSVEISTLACSGLLACSLGHAWIAPPLEGWQEGCNKYQ